jgi:hypothetical protein
VRHRSRIVLKVSVDARDAAGNRRLLAVERRPR